MSRPSIYHSTLNSTSTNSTSQNAPSSALQSRIQQKRAELQSLQQLRDLSSQLASQMSTLEQKLSTLRDGTEAVACVLRNWDSVLGVIGLVGAQAGRLVGADADGEEGKGEGVKLPETLVRIPVQDVNGAGNGTEGDGESGVGTARGEARVSG